jgi:hypothetical protein
MTDAFPCLIKEIHDVCSRSELFSVILLHSTDALINETTIKTAYIGTGYGTRIHDDLTSEPQQVFIELPNARQNTYKGHRVVLTSSSKEVHSQRAFTFKHDNTNGWMDVIKSVYKPIVAEKLITVMHIIDKINDKIYASGAARQESWTAFLAAYHEFLAVTGYNSGLNVAKFSTEKYFMHF